jgi:D-serine deaminase-like pyridoxal phosphate-dependent protein
MARKKFMLNEYRWNERYRVTGIEGVLTPALVIYPEIVASNIERTLGLLGGDPDRWRPHIKTAKLALTLGMLVKRGVKNFKCATTLELLIACQTGAADVLVAFPVVGANARRVVEIAKQFPHVRISVLVENEGQVQQWRESSVGVFVDINPGMNRTGVEQERTGEVVRLVQFVEEAKLQFRGLHYYDGQYGGLDEPERTAATHAGYDRLLKLVTALQDSGMSVREVITAGTPTFPCSLSYKGFDCSRFIHQISPGTIVYCDATCLAQLPAEYGYAPGALVLTRVVSRPHQGIITCDAGHKAVSADAGVPTCVVLGHPGVTPLAPSEEHLPMALSPVQNRETAGPRVGEALYLLPRHVCPTVNNFDSALIVQEGQIASVEKVTARGHEGPLLRNG